MGTLKIKISFFEIIRLKKQKVLTEK